MKLNENYARLNESYLFAGIAAKVREYKAVHPKADVVSLGIGDVTRPAHSRRHMRVAGSGARYGGGRDLPRLRPGAGIPLPPRGDRAALHGKGQ